MESTNKKSTTKKNSPHSKNSKSRKNRAARKIQTMFRKYRKTRLELLNTLLDSQECSLEKIKIGDENLFMYVEKAGEIIPLFNIFNFKRQKEGINDRSFFGEMLKVIEREEFHINYDHTFNIVRTEDDMIEITCVFNEFFQPISEEFVANYRTNYLMQFFIPYIYFILANSKMVLETGEEYNIMFGNPAGASDLVGFHKDDAIRTCLTYINSTVSTELSFDEEQLGLEWLTCSPLFRFDTTRGLYTLCFNDELLLHTIPIYESVDRSPAILNRLEEYETFRVRDVPSVGKVGEIARKQLSEEGLDVYQNKKGEIVKLEKKEKLNSRGEKLPLDKEDEYYRRVLIPENRRPLSKIANRKIIAGFIRDFFIEKSARYKLSPFTITTREPISVLLNYAIDSPEEQIELSDTSVRSILTTSRLGKMSLMG